MVICRHPKEVQAINNSLRQPGFDVAQFGAADINSALENGEAYPYIDVVFVDYTEFPGLVANNGKNGGLRHIWEMFPNAELVVMGPTEQTRPLVSLVKAGATNYLTYPLDHEEIRFVIDELTEASLRQSELDYLRDYAWREDVEQGAGVSSPKMRRLMHQVLKVAPTMTTLLISGETGTGKSYLAKQIHQESGRRDNAFITVHCGAIPENLVESELFGHEKGAFTGATNTKPGKFEVAGGGTIFLDEVGTLTPAAQIKLLQVLQDRTFHRVGGVKDIEADVRIIAATNEDLDELCRKGTFRYDLYYRLNVFPMHLPPLRERREDIPLLAASFLERLNTYYHKNIKRIAPEVLKALMEYRWPGNVRELDNLIERAYILESDRVLGVDGFPSEFFAFETRIASRPQEGGPTLAEVRRKGLELIERQYLQELLVLHNGRIDRTAAAAGVGTRQLHKLMLKHGLKKEDYK